jgi:hypothetical protein
LGRPRTLLGSRPIVDVEGPSWLSGRVGSTSDAVGQPSDQSMWKVLRGLAVALGRPRTLSGTRSIADVGGSSWLSGRVGPTSDAVGHPVRLPTWKATSASVDAVDYSGRWARSRERTPGRGFLRRDCVSGTRPFGGDTEEVPRRRTCPVGESRFVGWFGEVSRVCLGRASGGGLRGSGIRRLQPNALGVASGAAGLRVRGRHAGLAVLAARTRGADSGLALGVQGARSDADVGGLRSIR